MTTGPLPQPEFPDQNLPGWTGEGKTSEEWGESAAEVLCLIARREHSLRSLLELSRELRASRDPFEIGEIVLLNLMGQMGTARAVLWAVSDDGGGLVRLRSHGIRKEAAKVIGTILKSNGLSEDWDQAEPLLVEDVLAKLRASDMKIIESAGIAVLAPVLASGALKGVVGLGSRASGESYSEVDRQVIQSSLAILGVSLENATLFNDQREKHRQLAVANEHLLELDRLKSEFLSNVSHELKTPLAVIIAYAETLMDGEPPEEQRRAFLHTIHVESVRLLGLLEKLLDYSDLSRENRITVETLDLRPYVKNFVQGRLPGVTKGLREFTCEVDDQLPLARFDPKRLWQVLDAIIDNAVKFTQPGAHISLRLTHAWLEGSLYARIDIEDDGPGISRERLEHLFDPFRQGDGSMLREVGGLGLGLALARELVDQMDGRLEVTSDVGRGSKFTILLSSG